ncbi:MAG: NAD(P)H-dependent oxidoreductase subunit E, partial [Desulfobulbia bacterium]
TQFQLQPVGTKAHIQVCGTTPCMLRGAEDLIAVCKNKISEKQFETNEDGSLSWEEVECQGACVNAPMIMVFKDTYEDLTPERLEEIIDDFEMGKGAKIKPGPQIDRIYSAPAGGLTALTSDPNVSKTSVSKDSKAKTSAQKKTQIRIPASNKVAPATLMSDKNRPKSIKKPKQVDDLKLISGVGPKLEKVLHELGIFTYGQIASWKKTERNWVDNYLKFKGRIDRDDWIKQAKALAKGGRDEYVRVFGREPR